MSSNLWPGPMLHSPASSPSGSSSASDELPVATRPYEGIQRLVLYPRPYHMRRLHRLLEEPTRPWAFIMDAPWLMEMCVSRTLGARLLLALPLESWHRVAVCSCALHACVKQLLFGC